MLYVAEAMLVAAKEQSRSLTPQQLVKLVYLAHGWSMALHDQPLIDANVEAWELGVMIPTLYRATQQFGREVIDPSLVGSVSARYLPENVHQLIRSVFEKYGHLDGPSLSYLTSQANSPWGVVRASNMTKPVIPNSLICSHFLKQLDTRKKHHVTARP
ncbi:Panacea domain-containing protein [Methylobacillus sp. Pita2]|uniref:Panacea domain-containing protein n=1 Tax=Methylobacillus sp. Pita2 TaxID=3383245 RepID=UPI0038B426F7